MNQQQLIQREYRAIIQSVRELSLASEATQQGQKLLQVLKMGWLTPGSEILKRLESKKLAPRAVLRRPALLQQKWFHELSSPEKSRWLQVFWNLSAKTELSQLLGISKRRLQQLQQGVKRISSPEYTAGAGRHP